MSIRRSTLKITFEVGIGAQLYQYPHNSTATGVSQRWEGDSHEAALCATLNGIHSTQCPPGQISQVQVNSDLAVLLVPISGGKQIRLTLPGFNGKRFY